MVKEYTLYMQKLASGSSLKSSNDDFGFAVCEASWPEVKIKEVAKREWPGEHGEDVYVPPGGLKLQACDVDVDFIYKGDINTALAKYNAFRDYLIGAAGDGAELMVYDPYWKIGRTKVYLSEMSDIDANRTNIDEALSVKVKFHIPDPLTKVDPTFDTPGGDIVRLAIIVTS